METNTVNEYGWYSMTPPDSVSMEADVIIKILAQAQCKTVLDLGCGNGALIKKMQHAGFDAVGIENDENGCRLAQKNNPGTHIYHMGVQDVPHVIQNDFPHGFDAVVSTQVIEHLFSPQQLPYFASRILLSNGILVVSTPYHGFIKNLALSLFNHWDAHHTSLWEGGHIKFWSRRTLTELLEKNGYRVLSFYGIGRVPYLWKSMIVVAQKKLEG